MRTKGEKGSRKEDGNIITVQGETLLGAQVQALAGA